MRKQFLSLSTLTALVVCLSGCATKHLHGAVVPMQGGAQQSVVKSSDKAGAMRAFDEDAKATCGTAGAIPALDKPGKYSVVSQTSNEKTINKQTASDSKALDAAISFGSKRLGIQEKDQVELTTVFKCE